MRGERFLDLLRRDRAGRAFFLRNFLTVAYRFRATVCSLKHRVARVTVRVLPSS